MTKLEAVKEGLASLMLLKMANRLGSLQAYGLAEELKASLSKAPVNIVIDAFEQIIFQHGFNAYHYWDYSGLNLIILDDGGEHEILHIILG